MKRIFSLLAALLCLSVSSVWAQNATTTRKFSISDTPTPAAELTSGYYVLKIACKSKVGYAYVCKNANIATATEKCYGINYQDGLQLDTIGTHNSLAYLWYIGTTPDSKMLCIQNAGDASYFPKQSNHDHYDMREVRTLANAAAFRYTQVYGDLGVMLYQTNEKMNGGIPYVHANDNNNPNLFTMSCWENFSATDGSGSNCFFTFYKVNSEDDFTSNATPAIPIYKYKQQIDGVDTNVKTETENNVIVMKVGEAPIANNPFSYSSVLYDVTYPYPVSVASNTEEITVNFVKKTSSTIGLDTYHRLNIGRSTQLAVTKNGNISTKYCTKNFLANYYSSYWKFVQDGLQVKMVNCDGKYLKLASVPTSENDKGAVQYVDNASDATNLYLCEKPSNSAYTGNGGFILKVGDSSNNVAIGDHQNRNLCAWKNSGAFKDEGSCFVVADNAGFSVETASILSARIMKDQNTQTEISNNILRVADNASLNLAHSALSKLGENTIPGALIDAYNLAYKAKIDENAYYRIKNQGTSSNEATAKRYPSSEAIVTNTEGVLQASATRTITRKTASDNMVAQLWQFKDAGDGNYFIQNANTGCRWAATEDNVDMPTMENQNNAGHYSIDVIPVGGQNFSEGLINNVNDGKSKFFITLHLKGQHVINAYGGLNDFDILKEDNSQNAVPCNDPGNYWQIEKIDNFDVTISDARYATVGYPFPVQVTDTDVKVYYATEAENGILKLTEATNKIIPANQGAILYCESGATNANMKILSSTESTFADNKLTATTAKRDGFTTLTTYGLSKVNGVVCFRLNKSTDVPANKAYLDASKYTASGSAQQLLFSFDNVVEGIDNVVKAQNANKVYYDLQGRRVLYPAHGIFVTENGEKVFIK